MGSTKQRLYSAGPRRTVYPPPRGGGDLIWDILDEGETFEEDVEGDVEWGRNST